MIDWWLSSVWILCDAKMIDCPGCWAHSVPFTGVGPQVWWLDELTANHTESHITLTRLVAPSIVVFVSHFIGPLCPGAQGLLTLPCSSSQGHKVIWPLPVPSLGGTGSFDPSLFHLSGEQGHLTPPCSVSGTRSFDPSLFLVSGAQGHLTPPCSLSQEHKVIWPLPVPSLGHKFIWSCFLSKHYSVITLWTFLWCLCRYVLFYVCGGIGFVDWLEKGFIYRYERFYGVRLIVLRWPCVGDGTLKSNY